MALNYGKLNRSAAFNPTYAFPLDSRSYFESYDAAVAAAATAKEVGSGLSQYYFGQTLSVVDLTAGTANFYQIQPNGTLSKVVAGESGSSEITIDPNIFTKTEDGKLTLVGYGEAAVGTHLAKGSDGTVTWSTPTDSYTKSETDQKILEGIAKANQLSYKVVESLEDMNSFIESNPDLADKYIYLVPVTPDSALNANKYEEYMFIDGQTVKVGNWEVDLDNYVRKDEIGADIEGSRLLTPEEADKLSRLEPNFIKSVDEKQFNVDENGKLTLIGGGGSLPPDAANKLEDFDSILNGDGTSENPGLVKEVDDLDKVINGTPEIPGLITKVGDLSQLQTENKTNLVSAINELDGRLRWHDIVSG